MSDLEVRLTLYTGLALKITNLTFYTVENHVLDVQL